jgi:hypothetical protein
MLRTTRYTVRGVRAANRELNGWVAAVILLMVLLAVGVFVLLWFLVPAVIGGMVWVCGAVAGTFSERGGSARRRGALIASWPWRGLQRAIGE